MTTNADDATLLMFQVNIKLQFPRQRATFHSTGGISSPSCSKPNGCNRPRRQWQFSLGGSLLACAQMQQAP
jgi:hypothetical protein